MPRINIEEIWWPDPRRARLIEKLGSALMADGIMVNLWRIAQDFNGEPFEWNDYFDELHIQAVLSVGLGAVSSDGLLYVAGAKQHHDWLVSKRDASRKGGLRKAAREREINNLQLAPLQHDHAINKPSSSSSSSKGEKKEGEGANRPHLQDFPSEEDLGKYALVFDVTRQRVDLELELAREWLAGPANKHGRKMGKQFLTNWFKRTFEKPKEPKDHRLEKIKEELFKPHPTQRNWE